MDDLYSFRYKVRLSETSRLPFQQSVWHFPASKHNVRIAAVGVDTALQDAGWIAIRGDNYETEARAKSAADEARQILQRAFAALRLGADFGNQGYRSTYVSPSTLKQLETEDGRPVLADSSALLVFPSHPQPAFIAAEARIHVRRPVEKVVEALTHPGARLPCTSPENSAHELFGASFFLGDSPEGRLLLLTAALESLLGPQHRTEGVAQLVDAWCDELLASDLGVAERDSLLGQLGFLKKESINQAGQRLVTAVLKGRQFGGQSPSKFFRRAYTVRSKILHASVPVDRQEVLNVLPGLEDMVGDLLAGPSMFTG